MNSNLSYQRLFFVNKLPVTMDTHIYNFYLSCIIIFKSIRYIQAISIRRFSVCSPSFGLSLSQHWHLKQSAPVSPGSSVISSQPSGRFCYILFKNHDSICILLNLWNQFYMHQNNLNMFEFCLMQSKNDLDLEH